MTVRKREGKRKRRQKRCRGKRDIHERSAEDRPAVAGMTTAEGDAEGRAAGRAAARKVGRAEETAVEDDEENGKAG